MDEYHKDTVELNKSGMKGKLLFDSIYIRFKTVQNKSTATGIRWVITLVFIETRRKHTRCLLKYV